MIFVFERDSLRAALAFSARTHVDPDATWPATKLCNLRSRPRDDGRLGRRLQVLERDYATN